ncbi:uncharacterized protein [Typha angustifolia]|uniref:uncharacterized protein n=1 Tax=Typha angustifolia TaxID=59011 RepID=UPI003C2CA17C
MDSSQLIGDAEECNSSESGWTMYLASPMHDDGDDGDDGDGEVEGHGYDGSSKRSNTSGGSNGDDGDDDDDDDDSLASDASTGPAQEKYSHRRFGGSKAMDDHFKHDGHDDVAPEAYSQFSSNLYKKVGKVEKKDVIGKSPKPFHSHREASPSNSSSHKVRKSNLIGK